MVPDIDPKVDFAFKKTFGGEASGLLLPHLIDAVRRRVSSHRVTAVEVLNPFSDKMTLDEKLAILDVKARDEEGHWFNLEMQMVAVLGLRQRFLYYWAKVYCQQLNEGEEYYELRPTISICFVNAIVFRGRSDFHTVFKLKSEDGRVCLTDDLEIHILELPKFNKALGELSEPLDLWLYFLKNGKELDADNLPEPLDTPEIRGAMEVLKKMAQSTIEREIYEGRIKARRDAQMIQRAMEEAQAAVREKEAAVRGKEAALREKEAALRETETSLRKTETSLRETQATLAAERAQRQRQIDEVDRQSALRRIQLCQRLLRQSQSSEDELSTRTIPELHELAEQLEAKLINSTTGGST